MARNRGVHLGALAPGERPVVVVTLVDVSCSAVVRGLAEDAAEYVRESPVEERREQGREQGTEGAEVEHGHFSFHQDRRSLASPISNDRLDTLRARPGRLLAKVNARAPTANLGRYHAWRSFHLDAHQRVARTVGLSSDGWDAVTGPRSRLSSSRDKTTETPHGRFDYFQSGQVG